jgi:hypothetical protein
LYFCGTFPELAFNFAEFRGIPCAKFFGILEKYYTEFQKNFGIAMCLD